MAWRSTATSAAKDLELQRPGHIHMRLKVRHSHPVAGTVDKRTGTRRRPVPAHGAMEKNDGMKPIPRGSPQPKVGTLITIFCRSIVSLSTSWHRQFVDQYPGEATYKHNQLIRHMPRLAKAGIILLDRSVLSQSFIHGFFFEPFVSPCNGLAVEPACPCCLGAPRSCAVGTSSSFQVSPHWDYMI